MNYVTRPVFQFETDWSDAPTKQFRFDLREIELGFGAEYFATLQTHVVQGYALNLTLRDAAEVQAFDDFFAALAGRLQGFWLPTPFEAVEIVTADDATHFYIADQNLRATFEDHPDIYLLLSRAGDVRAAKIAAVASASGGRERVTLTAALANAATTADTVCRLHYVRLATDEESGVFLAEGIQTRELRVVELPHEYEAFETGQSPIWLYRFSCSAPRETVWCYTSFAAGVVSGNVLFEAFPMTHRGLKKSAKLDNETLDIEAKFDAAHPLALFLPLPLTKPLNVEVLKVTLADPETQERVFNGTVRTVEDQGEKLIAHCDSWLAVLKRKVPRMAIQKECNYMVFEDRTCKVPRWRFETTGTVTAVENTTSLPYILLALDNAASPKFADWMSDDWFAQGFIEAGFGSAYQVRGIISSLAVAGELKLELNAPLDIEVGSQVALVPGCDGLAATCQAKFNNFDNFGGFLAVPQKNLSLQAMDAIVSQGGKK